MLRKVGVGFVAKLYSAGLMFVISVFSARILGPELFGYYNIVVTLIPVFAYIFVFGQDQYLLSLLSSKSKKYLDVNVKSRIAHSVSYSFLTLILLLIILFTVSANLSYISEKIYFSFLCIIIVGYIYSLRRIVLINFRVNGSEVKAILPETVLYPTFLFFGLCLLFIFKDSSENDFFWVLLLLTLSAFFSMLPFFAFMGSTKITKFDFSKGQIWLKQGWIFAILTIAEASIFFVDRIMVFYNFGPSFLSYYQVALRFVEILLVFESAYLLVSMPKIANLFSENRFSEINFLCKKQTRLVFFFNLLGAGFIFFAAPYLIELYGDGYEDSIVLLKIFSVYLIVSSILGPSTYVCTVLKQEFFSLIVALFFVILFVFLFLMFKEEISLVQLVLLKCLCDFTRRFICSVKLYRININVFLR